MDEEELHEIRREAGAQFWVPALDSFGLFLMDLAVHPTRTLRGLGVSYVYCRDVFSHSIRSG